MAGKYSIFQYCFLSILDSCSALWKLMVILPFYLRKGDGQANPFSLLCTGTE